jgi:hypothetical protein
MIKVKFRIHERLVLSLGKYITNNFMNNQRLIKPFSRSVLKYFQLGNVHLAEDTCLQALEHIT